MLAKRNNKWIALLLTLVMLLGMLPVSAVAKGGDSTITEYHFIGIDDMKQLWVEEWVDSHPDAPGIQKWSFQITQIQIFGNGGKTSNSVGLNLFYDMYAKNALKLGSISKYIQPDSVSRIEITASFYEDGNIFPKVKTQTFKMDRFETEMFDGFIELTPKTNGSWDGGEDGTMCTVTFDLNGGTAADGWDENQRVPENGYALEPDTNLFYNDGHNFDGWYKRADGGKPFDFGATPVTQDITLYAHWTEIPETAYAPAEFFVLDPQRGEPADGADQGAENYLPNNKDNGGVEGCNADSGYVGGYITQTAADLIPNRGDRYADLENGLSSEYVLAPENLGDFNGKDIVWYVISKPNDFNYQEGKADYSGTYHVDGYVKNASVAVTYHSNFGEDATYAHETKTGDYTTLTYDAASLPQHPNQYMQFKGWGLSKDEVSYAESETFTLMTELNLYAIWERQEQPPADAEQVNWYINLAGEILNVDSVKSDASTSTSRFTGKLAADQDIARFDAWKDDSRFAGSINYNDATDASRGGLVGASSKDAAKIDKLIDSFMTQYIWNYPGDQDILDAVAADKNQVHAVNGKLVDKSMLTTEYYDVQWYVLKYVGTGDKDHQDGWHIDGVMLEKDHNVPKSYTVQYQWDGQAPEGVQLPENGAEVTYAEDALVTIDTGLKAGDQVTVGDKVYTFEGWTIGKNPAVDFNISKNTVIQGAWTVRTIVSDKTNISVWHYYGSVAPEGMEIPATADGRPEANATVDRTSEIVTGDFAQQWQTLEFYKDQSTGYTQENHPVAYSGYNIWLYGADGLLNEEPITSIDGHLDLTEVQQVRIHLYYDEVSVKPDTHTLTTQATNATILEGYTFNHDDKATIDVTFKANDGYHITSVTVDGEALTGEALDAAVAAGKVVVDRTRDHSVAVTASKKGEPVPQTHTLTTQATNAAILEGYTFDHDDKVTIDVTFKANEGYRVTAIT